jgi:hypothetical protein
MSAFHFLISFPIFGGTAANSPMRVLREKNKFPRSPASTGCKRNSNSKENILKIWVHFGKSRHSLKHAHVSTAAMQGGHVNLTTLWLRAATPVVHDRQLSGDPVLRQLLNSPAWANAAG